MIATRRLQRNFADGFIAEAVGDLWEPWMGVALILDIVMSVKPRGQPYAAGEVLGRLRAPIDR